LYNFRVLSILTFQTVSKRLHQKIPIILRDVACGRSHGGGRDVLPCQCAGAGDRICQLFYMGWSWRILLPPAS
ncbi:hypothetical protein, partial [Novacetimonas hansenii]|uniref:hypothetical protein n=2 Tax=Novacetimonas hansenii TaxID=436 RepID=UPI001A7E7729